MFRSELSLSPVLSLRVQRVPQASLMWKLQNTLRWGFIWGWLSVMFARAFSTLTGIPTLTSDLKIRVRRANGEWINYGTVGYRVVTDVGADKISDAFNNAFELQTFNYHGIGTGSTAEAVGDTALVTESTTALNPDSTRATGTQSNPASKQYRSIGTLTADAQIVAREHGLFDQAATGGGNLFDRTVYATITLESGDSLQATYTLSVTSGS